MAEAAGTANSDTSQTTTAASTAASATTVRLVAERRSETAVRLGGMDVIAAVFQPAVTVTRLRQAAGS